MTWGAAWRCALYLVWGWLLFNWGMIHAYRQDTAILNEARELVERATAALQACAEEKKPRMEI